MLIDWPVPFLVAAIDPAAEARLQHLDEAVVAGRYLSQTDTTTSSAAGSDSGPSIPVLVSSRVFQDDVDHVSVSRLSVQAAQRMRDGLSPQQLDDLVASSPAEGSTTGTVSAEEAYQALLTGLSSNTGSYVDAYWTAGPVGYEKTGPRSVTAAPVTNPDSVWASQFQASGFAITPLDNSDTGFRTLTEHVGTNVGDSFRLPRLRSVGRFDPERLLGFGDPATQPLQTYSSPVATGADPATRTLLGDRSLLPNGNLAGYLQQPPLMLTTLAAAKTLTDPAVYGSTTSRAPISVIRVRVTGVTGPDKASLARIQQVATLITQSTGLDVDITAGSSPTQVAVALPAGVHGRPPLTLLEPWVKKGVAVSVLSAVDRKSLLLFGLVFVVCGLFGLSGRFRGSRLTT